VATPRAACLPGRRPRSRSGGVRRARRARRRDSHSCRPGALGRRRRRWVGPRGCRLGRRRGSGGRPDWLHRDVACRSFFRPIGRPFSAWQSLLSRSPPLSSSVPWLASEIADRTRADLPERGDDRTRGDDRAGVARFGAVGPPMQHPILGQLPIRADHWRGAQRPLVTRRRDRFAVEPPRRWRGGVGRFEALPERVPPGRQRR
jgi:hypothetical protein